jgi:hypothetical protein
VSVGDGAGLLPGDLVHPSKVQKAPSLPSAPCWAQMVLETSTLSGRPQADIKSAIPAWCRSRKSRAGGPRSCLSRSARDLRSHNPKRWVRSRSPLFENLHKQADLARMPVTNVRHCSLGLSSNCRRPKHYQRHPFTARMLHPDVLLLIALATLPPRG